MSEELKKEIQELTPIGITLRLGKMVAYKRVADKLEKLLQPVKAGQLTAGKVLIELIDFLADQMKDLEKDLTEND